MGTGLNKTCRMRPVPSA